MNSLAIAIKATNNETTSPIEMHINLIDVKQTFLHSKRRIFIDFGFFVGNDVTNLCLFLPFEIIDNRDDIDLVEKFQNDNAMLCSLFNADLKINSNSKSVYTEVVNNSSESHRLFNLCQLNKANISIERITNNNKCGTKLNIELPKNETYKTISSDRYIRFRIEPRRASDVIVSESISNDLIQSAFSVKDLIDLRFNEIRNIDKALVPNFPNIQDKFVLAKFKLIHFYYITESDREIKEYCNESTGCRMLEKEKWNSYLPSQLTDKHHIAYHWKTKQDKEALDKYDIFFSSVHPSLSFLRVLNYAYVVIILSYIGSFLCSETDNRIYDLLNTNSGINISDIVFIALCIWVGVSWLITHFRIYFRIFRR